MKIKIISDGKAFGTSVIDAETGRQIPGVVGVTWSAHVGDGLVHASIELLSVDIEANAEIDQPYSNNRTR